MYLSLYLPGRPNCQQPGRLARPISSKERARCLIRNFALDSASSHGAVPRCVASEDSPATGLKCGFANEYTLNWSGLDSRRQCLKSRGGGASFQRRRLKSGVWVEILNCPRLEGVRELNGHPSASRVAP